MRTIEDARDIKQIRMDDAEIVERENFRLRAIIQRVIKYATPYDTTFPTQEILAMLGEANTTPHASATEGRR